MWDFKLHEKFVYFDLFDYHYKILKNIVKAIVVPTGTTNTCLTRKSAAELLSSNAFTFTSICMRSSLGLIEMEGIVVGC